MEKIYFLRDNYGVSWLGPETEVKAGLHCIGFPYVKFKNGKVFDVVFCRDYPYHLVNPFLKKEVGCIESAERKGREATPEEVERYYSCIEEAVEKEIKGWEKTIEDVKAKAAKRCSILENIRKGLKDLN